MVSSRFLKKVTREQWQEIRHHALQDNPFPLIFEKCPYVTVHIAENCLFAIVPRHQLNFLKLYLRIVPRPNKKPPDIDRIFWDEMEAEAWDLINLKHRDINH